MKLKRYATDGYIPEIKDGAFMESAEVIELIVTAADDLRNAKGLHDYWRIEQRLREAVK